MVNKKSIIGFEFLFVLLLIVSVLPSVFADDAVSEASFCCERSKVGAWCVNAPEDQCNPSYSAAPTSCETTSYCQLGTCYESEEGICMENTPQKVCENDGGTWSDKSVEQLPQCQLGCCIIADQAAFVPLVRCKRLSTLFGIENNYRTDITDEMTCIATAQSQDKGACVYDEDFQKTCEFTTRGECTGDEDAEGGKTFYKDLLCSFEDLATNCAKQSSTTCYKGDVYWVDSCGNYENVYSNDEEKSWNNGRVLEPSEVCDPSNGDDKACGNCDYMLGTRCSESSGFFSSEAFCKKTVCVDRDGDSRINGESWCVQDDGAGNGEDRVGSRYYRELCVDGEVIVEPCADFRNEICIESSTETTIGDFSSAACKVNKWQDCILQEDEEDCIKESRDCIWIDDIVNGTIIGAELWSIEDKDEEEDKTESIIKSKSGICVAKISPGLEFWKEGNAQEICAVANERCVVTYEVGIIGQTGNWKTADMISEEEGSLFGLKKKVIEGSKDCLDNNWALKADQVCSAMGDCGGYVNYNKVYTDDGYKWTEAIWDANTIWETISSMWKTESKSWKVEDKEFSSNDKIKIKGGFVGMLIAPMVIGGINE
jgi:hypothetical protein